MYHYIFSSLALIYSNATHNVYEGVIWILEVFKRYYLPTPPLGQDMTQGQFFKRSLTGLNSEFSFS